MFEAVLASKVCQRSLGKVLAVSQCHAILQVVDGTLDDSKPFLGDFKGLQTEIAKSKGIFQEGVIDFDRPAFLVVSQGLLNRQG